MPLIRYVGDQPRDESSVTANSSRWWPGEMRRLESGARANALLSARQGWELVTDADGATVQPLTAAQVQAVQALLSGDVITVGTGGEHSTLEEAGERAIARSPTADRWARIVIMPGSALTLSAAVELPQFCAVIGACRESSIVTGAGDVNIKYRKWNLFKNFTLRYSGIGATSGGFRNSTSIGAASRDGSTVRWHDMNLDVTAERRSAIWAQFAEFFEVRGCQIRSSGIGVEFISGYDMHIRDTDIFVTNVNTGQSHIGVRHMGGRLTLWNPKIACGYGPLGQGDNNGISDEANQNVVGIYSGSTGADSRCDVFGIWSIMRNQAGSDPGVKNVCIWNDSNFNVTRVWSGYLQVENGDNSSDGDNYEILNTGTPGGALGLVQVSPSVRARRIGGPVYQTGPAIGMPPVVTASTTLGVGMGGIHRVNAASGDITITLPNPAQASNFTPNVTQGERHLFKRVVSPSNTITIAAAGTGTTIEGSASVALGSTLYSQVEVVWSESDNMWLIV